MVNQDFFFLHLNIFFLHVHRPNEMTFLALHLLSSPRASLFFFHYPTWEKASKPFNVIHSSLLYWKYEHGESLQTSWLQIAQFSSFPKQLMEKIHLLARSFTTETVSVLNLVAIAMPKNPNTQNRNMKL